MRQQILVIDDSENIHPLVKAVLGAESVDVHSATDATFGLVLAASIRPDLILLDVDMPGVGGFEAARLLKADPATADCPIIFLTGQSSPQEKVTGFGLGAVDYVTKPFNPTELLARVRSSLKTHRALRSLESKSLTDPLTGLWNRTMFNQRLNAEAGLRARFDSPLAIIMGDLDGFKKINDLYGHLSGDEVLKGFSKIVSSLCRVEDVACRFGGEEFVIIAPHTSAADAAVLAERIRKTFAESRYQPAVSPSSPLAKQEFRVTASFGVAAATDPYDRSMLQRADDAMYQAKQAGRNRVSVGAGQAVPKLRAA